MLSNLMKRHKKSCLNYRRFMNLVVTVLITDQRKNPATVAFLRNERYSYPIKLFPDKRLVDPYPMIVMRSGIKYIIPSRFIYMSIG